MFHFQLAELRKRRRLTQQELADVFCVSNQTISKWETGASYPDLSLIPQIASFFGVSADALLGLIPLDSAYQPSVSGASRYWDQRLEYLKRTRTALWNEDYLRFLIHSVWKLDQRPISILDCGCGYGALGLLLMPLLPEGSTYTGVDFSAALLEDGRACFEASGMEGTFIEADLRTYTPCRTFDLVVSQALLRHLDDGEGCLRQMASWTKAGGLVAVMEVNREFEADGLYVHGMDYSQMCRHEGLSRLWQTEREQQGRDHGIAMKIPHYMKSAGLIRIGCRMNDRVTYLDPDVPDYDCCMNDLIKARQWEREKSEKEQEQVIAYFLNHGMSRKEAENYCMQQNRISSHLLRSTASLTQVSGMMISYGWKP